MYMKKLSVLFSLLIVLFLSLPVNCFADTYQASDFQKEYIKSNFSSINILLFRSNGSFKYNLTSEPIFLDNYFCIIYDTNAYSYDGIYYRFYADVISDDFIYRNVIIPYPSNYYDVFIRDYYYLNYNDSMIARLYPRDNLSAYGIVIEQTFDIYPLNEFLAFVKVMVNSGYFFFVGVLAFLAWCAHEIKKWLSF